MSCFEPLVSQLTHVFDDFPNVCRSVLLYRFFEMNYGSLFDHRVVIGGKIRIVDEVAPYLPSRVRYRWLHLQPK